MNKEEIKKILPHRDPYLMIDEVIIEKEGEKGRGLKKLTGKEYFFEGHFPGHPVMPGVLIVEAIAQTAMAVLRKGDLKLKCVRKVKFRQTIEPKDTMEIKVELINKDDNQYEIAGEVLVEENIAASGNIILK